MDEIFDEGLMEIMGERYDGGDDPVQMPVMDRKVAQNKQEVTFTPAERKAMARLGNMTKWVGICGGISMLMWWFWVNDLMAMEAAYPCILACGVIGAFGAGMNFRK